MTTEKPQLADHTRQPANNDAETSSGNSTIASNSHINKKEVEAEHKKPVEIGGPKGLEPTRYGDWEAKGRCYDF